MGDEPTQETQPAKGDPVEIPVPKREAWDEVLKKSARPSEHPSDDDLRKIMDGALGDDPELENEG